MTETVTLGVAGMTCGHCAKTVEQSVRLVPGVVRASVDLRAATLKAEVDPSRVDRAEVARAVERAGYEVAR